MDQLTPGADDFSVNALEQAFQSARTGLVTELDRGPDWNMAEYGQAEPPRIPLENIQIPTMVYQGNLDQTSDITDTNWFIDQISGNTQFNSENGESVFLGINFYDNDYVAFVVGNEMPIYLDDVIEVSNQYPIER